MKSITKQTFLKWTRSLSVASLILALPLFAMEDVSQKPSPTVRSLLNPKEPKFQDLIQELRTGLRQSDQDEKTFVLSSRKYFPILMKSLIDYVEGAPESAENRLLRTTLQAHLEAGHMNSITFLANYFKAAHLRADPSSEEKDVLQHALSGLDSATQYLLSGLSDSHGWEKYLCTFFGERSFSEGDSYIFVHASEDLVRHIRAKSEEKLDTLFPHPLTIPVPNASKFRVEDTIEWALNHVYPLSFPERGLTAHGTSISPVGFALHDFLHAITSSGYTGLKNHIFKEIDKTIGREEDALEFMETYIPQAVGRYLKQIEMLKDIFAFLKTLNPSEKKPALAGLFWMIHETSSFEHTLRDILPEDSALLAEREEFSQKDDPFVVSSPEDVLKTLVRNAKVDVFDKDAWLSSEDPLFTSPLTGEKLLSDEELGTLYLAEHPTYSTCTINPTRRFIDITLTGKNKPPRSTSNPTLAHKWENMEDSLAILRYAEVNLKKPDLSSLETSQDQRDIAQKFLIEVQKNLTALLDAFQEKGLDFLRRQPPLERGAAE